MRWWILGAVLAGLAAAIAAGGFAGAEGELRLDLKSQRLWCTAGTLVRVDWEAGGGELPYAVTVQGEPMSTHVGTTRVGCDALPRYPLHAGGEPARHGEMTISAEVADAAGARATATARVLIAPPLPAPTGLELNWWNPRFNVYWEPVAGAGSLTTFESCGRNSLPCGTYLLRYRAVGADDWIYQNAPERFGRIPWERDPDGVEEMQLAALRHRVESHSPDALNWSPLARYAATRQAGVATLNADHRSIALVWANVQEYEQTVFELHGPDDIQIRTYQREQEHEWLGGYYRTTFDQLRPDQRYTFKIIPSEGEAVSLPIMTAPPPAGSPPLMRLELSAGRGSCTAGTETEVDWTVSGGRAPYQVEIGEATGEGISGAARIACGIAPRGGGGGMLGYAPRIVRGTVVDADGARAEAQFTLLAGPPLAPPQVDPPEVSHRGFYVPFWIRVSRVDYPSWRVALRRVAMRWRVAGETEWSYNVDGISNGPWDDLGWANGWVSADIELADAMVFETQVARVRHSREIEHPQALVWTEIATLTTASDPVGLVAESTHDSISLSWGPQVEGLNYIATLDPFPPGEGQSPTVRFGYGYEPRGYAVEPQPPYGISWNNLCPGTRYFAAVRSDAASNGEWDTPVGLLITTEPAPDAAELPPVLEASAGPDRIVLRWHPDSCALHESYRYVVREQGKDEAVAHDYFRRDEDAELIVGLASRTVYDLVAWSSGYGAPPGREFRVSISTTEREQAVSSDPPPEFSVRHVYRHGRSGPRSAFEVQKQSRVGDVIELEWHIDGRRVRRMFHDRSLDIFGLPQGWYEFRARGIDDEGRAMEWSEPVRAATKPLAPGITSTRYQSEHLIVTWNEPEDGVPIDRYIVEWRHDGQEWQGIEVETGGWAAIPSSSFIDSEGGHVRLTAVSGEYGAGDPSEERQVDPPRPPLFTLGFDTRGCGQDGSGTFDVAWMIERGVAPFRLRLRPINSSAEDPETVMIDGNDREGRQQFNCADAARQADSGDWETAVGYRLKDYTYPPAAAGIRSARFGTTSWWSGSGSSRQQWEQEQYLGQRYGEMPAPGLVDQSVHAEHVKWWLGGAGDPQVGQRWVVRTRESAREPWVERDMHYGSWPMGWWFVDDLEPGTRYEYAFGRYFDGGNEWSETGVVTTLGEVAGIAASEEGDAVVVEWDTQPDAWMYSVRLRGQGRSWWTLHDATEDDRERAVFAGAAGHGPYTAEVVTPPKDAAGEDESTFQLYQGPH